MELPQADGPLVLHVRSDAYEEGSEMPEEYSADGRNISPSVAWSGVPAGRQSIVVIVEDPDAPPPADAVRPLAGVRDPAGGRAAAAGHSQGEAAGAAGGDRRV